MTTDIAAMLRDRRRAQGLAPKAGPAPSACRITGMACQGPVDDEGWRTHPDWADATLGTAWTAILGRQVPDDWARTLTAEVGNPAYFVTGEADDPGHRKPWQHVGEQMREQAGHVLYRLANADRPKRHTAGRGCAWCGARLSARWYPTTSVAWPDGGESVLCTACYSKDRAHGWGYDDEQWRAAACALMLGIDQPYQGLHLDLRVFAEARPADPAGTEKPWEYLGEERRKARLAWLASSPWALSRYATDPEREQITKVAALRAEAAPRPADEPLVRVS